MMHATLRKQIRNLLFPILISGAIYGCMPGTIETVVGTGYVYDQKRSHEYKNDVDRAVGKYIADHANSPCTNGEDRVIESGVDVIKNFRLSGFDEVIERLNAIYSDSEQPDNVRAAALYNMAILNSRKLEPNKARAREYFKQLYVEFPDQYRCVFEASEWRDSMIEQQLLMPGETVESFLEDAQKDVERRKKLAQ
ncbi:MAG TPA: hypothetical protein VL091_13195 [Marinobacter sp.]|nr:hypothetical protein [Marinobacter sp.]